MNAIERFIDGQVFKTGYFLRGIYARGKSGRKKADGLFSRTEQPGDEGCIFFIEIIESFDLVPEEFGAGKAEDLCPG